MSDTFPPVSQWPVPLMPDCPICQATTDVVFIGAADRIDGGQVHVWRCRACPADWTSPIIHWPVLDGPDCPYCNSTVTCWASIEPDHLGDLWLCEHGHEFVLTPEGLIILPEDAA